MFRKFLFATALCGFLAVGFGAFGAHGLRTRLSEADMAIYRTAVDYHFWHALGLGLVSVLARWMPNSRALWWAGCLMVAGLILFSGSLYALCLTGQRWLGAITPFGGTAFLAAWAALGIAALRQPPET